MKLFTTLLGLVRSSKPTRFHSKKWRPQVESLEDRTLLSVFFGLGDLNGGQTGSTAVDVSADGSVVVGDSYSDRGREPFRWTSSTGMVGLGGFPGASRVNGVSTALSSDGNVVVGQGFDNQGNPQAFRWTEATGVMGLGFLPSTSTYPVSVAEDVSGDGSVVVGRSNISASDPGAFRWTQATGIEFLGDLPGKRVRSVATAISQDGNVIVGESESDLGAQAFRWTAQNGMVPLDQGDFVSIRDVVDVSTDGTVIVGDGIVDLGNNLFGRETFRWTAQTGMVRLGDLPGGYVQSIPTAVSGDGSIIVGVGDTDGNFETAYYWDKANGMRPLQTVLENTYGLDLSGWSYITAEGISEDGLTLVGDGINPSGDVEAWVAHLGIQPDIFIQNAQFVSGDTLQLTYTTSGLSEPFDVGVFRSADTTFDASDVLVGSPISVNPGPLNQSITQSLTVSNANDPLWRDDARPYILVVADPYGTITESSESNNVAAFQPPPYCTIGESFNNVLLPEVNIPFALPAIPLIKPTTHLNLRFDPLGVDFTVQSTNGGNALCSLESNIGSLTLSVGPQNGSQGTTFGYSTGQATLTVFGGPTPYITWHTDQFHFSPVPPIPDLGIFNFGPYTRDVTLQTLGLTLATPLDTTIRTAEAYFHTLLSQQLLVTQFLHTLFVIQDPGSTDLLVTGPSGQQTGQRVDGTIVSQIPFSAYLPEEPVVLVFSPQPGTYETDVTGRMSGSYALVTEVVSNLTIASGVQVFTGELEDGQTVVYTTHISSGIAPVTSIDPGRTLTFFLLYIDHIEATGSIANHGITNSLQSKVANAQWQLSLGHFYAIDGTLGAFINEVDAQRGKSISIDAADELMGFTSFLLDFVL